MKPLYMILDILSVSGGPCIMNFSAQYKNYFCACAAMTYLPISFYWILPGNSYMEKYGYQ